MTDAVSAARPEVPKQANTADAEYAIGVGDRACEKPDGWDEVAAGNSRALEEMLALPRDGSVNPRYRVTVIDAG